MTFLPIVERELRTAARKPGTYWGRLGIASVALAMSAYVVVVASRLTQNQVGMTTFSVLSVGSFLYCLFSGVRLTSDCISAEKREGTLGFLFLTDLKGYDVVLGKLTASSVHSIYALLGVFPIMGLTIVLGGVSGKQCLRVAGVLLSTLLFSLGVGMMVSTFSRVARRATATSMVLIILLASLPVWIMLLEAWRYELPEPRFGWLAGSPAFGLWATLTDMWGVAKQPGYTISVTIPAVLGVVFLGLASLKVPLSWQDRPATSWRERWRHRMQQWAYGSDVQRVSYRERLMDVNPFYWLAARDRLQPSYVWMFLGALTCIWLWGFLYHRDYWLESQMASVILVGAFGIIKFWSAASVVQRLAEDRRNSALELILSTPLTVKEILHGQLRALERQFLWPVVLVLICSGLACAAAVREAYDDRGFLVAMYICYGVVFVADLLTLPWLGMWLALSGKPASQASATALSRVLVFPWVLFIILITAYNFAPFEIRRQLDWSQHAALVCFTAISLGNDIFWWIRSRNLLYREFRKQAVQRFQGKPTGWWRSLFNFSDQSGSGLPGQ